MHEQPSEVYGGNLQAHGQNRRLRLGAAALTVALVAAVILVQVVDVPRVWRLVLFVPFMAAAFGAWQGLYRVCPGLASKGCREGVHGEEKRILKPEEAKRAKAVGLRVLGGSFVTAALATLLVFFVR